MDKHVQNQQNGRKDNDNDNDNDNTKCDFVKLVRDFTKDILTTFPEQADTLNENLRQIVIVEDGGVVDEEYTDAVWRKCAKVYPPRFFDILYQNTEIFDENETGSAHSRDDEKLVDVHFLPGIDFRKLWKQDISDKTRETIWKYLQLILLRVVSETSEERSFGDTAKLFEAIDENALKEKLEQTIKDMEGLFNTSGTSDNDGEQETGEGECDADGDCNGDADGTKKTKNMGDLPNPEDLHNHISGLMKGKLGRLAQEIAEETASDLSDELGDIKSADQVFHKLFKNPGKLMSLVKKVGSKLEEKIKSGEIKESDLLKEAGEFVTKMKDMPGLGNLKNMFGQMGMPGLGKDAKINMGALNNMMRGAQTRDRLRAKLAKKNEQNASSTLVEPFANRNGGDGSTNKFSTGEVVEKSSRNQQQSQTLTQSETTSVAKKSKKKKNKNKKK